jgi:hypothetical protein
MRRHILLALALVVSFGWRCGTPAWAGDQRVAQLQPSPGTGPLGPLNPRPGPTLPPHIAETDRQIIEKTLDGVTPLSAMLAQLQADLARVQQAVAALQAVSEATAAQVRHPPSWSQRLEGAQRWQHVLGGEAVLDRETGLIWQRQPSTALFPYADAIDHCFNGVAAGQRRGWRLPTPAELTSLSPLDLSVVGAANPFAAVPSGEPRRYWTSVMSTIPAYPVASAFVVSNRGWQVSEVPTTSAPQVQLRAESVICVRGGSDTGFVYP